MIKDYTWYSQLIKPSWAPPSSIFGPVWAVLYAIIIVSFGAVFYKVFTKQIPWIVALPFALNLIFNLAFTPIQFGLKNNFLAMIDVLLVLGTLVWGMIMIWRFAPHSFGSLGLIVYTNIPYLIWVAFATILQINITYLNR